MFSYVPISKKEKICYLHLDDYGYSTIFKFVIKKKHMTTKLQNIIDSQLKWTKGRNFLSGDVDASLWFISETGNIIGDIKNLHSDEINEILDYLVESALSEFCRVNQYYSFDENAKVSLKECYRFLFDRMIKINENDISEELKRLAKDHLKNLNNWLLQTNPFAEKMYREAEAVINAVPCAEYSADFQIDLMGIKLSDIVEPVLDIGCGKEANLIKYLRGRNIEAFGFDRFENNYPYCETADWLEYNYGSGKWGTIISNLGFTNHFVHHHYRIDGNFEAYAKTYMRILNSLKRGGKFYYSPGVSFIENYLDERNYKITIKEDEVSSHRVVVVEKC